MKFMISITDNKFRMEHNEQQNEILLEAFGKKKPSTSYSRSATA